MVRWLYDLYERTRDTAAVQFFMEANFMQDVILDEFEAEGNLRGYQLPIMPDKRKKPDKLQRIEAVSPLWERGFVFYNEKLKESPDMQTGIEQTWSVAAVFTMMHRMPTREPSGCCSAIQGRRVFNRCSVKGRPPKIYGNMIQLIKRMIFAWRYKRAVARACKYAKLYGRKYYVLYMGGKLKVVPKRNICELIHRHRFRKGTTIRDIEKMALFITK